MKRNQFASGLAVTLLSTLSLPGSVAAVQPFEGSLEGSFTVTPLDPPFASVLVEATGHASGFGDFTLTFPHTVNFATRAGSGQYELTFANGDLLFADVTGNATPTADDPANLNVVETATVTGGTGRFAGLTGSFTTQRLTDGTALTTVGTFTGTLVPEPSAILLVLGCAAGCLAYCATRRRRS